MGSRRPALKDAPAAADLNPVLEGILEKYGYDFRDYARPAFDRRVLAFMKQEEIPDLGTFSDRIQASQEIMQRFLMTLSVNATAMFKEPETWLGLRRDVIPVLRTYPFIRIWHAGCSTGQEVYSTAIMLAEEGLYDRCRIYATDMDETALRKARDGIYSLAAMRKYGQYHAQAGGKAPFTGYYTAKYNSAIINASLRKNIVFGQHNLVSDGSFNEFQAIFCRNVLSYFNPRLQDRVMGLFHGSLGMFGYLGLGAKEGAALGGYRDGFQEADPAHGLWRKVA